MSKKPDGTKSAGSTHRVHREYHPDYYQPSNMRTRAERAAHKKAVESEQLLGLTTRRRALARVKHDPNAGYRLTLNNIYDRMVPSGVNLRDFKLARAAAVKQAARRQGPRAR